MPIRVGFKLIDHLTLLLGYVLKKVKVGKCYLFKMDILNNNAVV